MKKVLFFTPHSTLTGSEVLLWNFLNYYNRQKIQAALYSDREGRLITTLPYDIPYFISPFQKRGLSHLAYKLLQHTGIFTPERYIINLHNSLKPDCWYLNTVLMLYLIPLAKRLGVKTVVHINELNSLYECVSHKDMSSAMQQADMVVGITEHICDLARTMGATNVVHQNCFVDLKKRSVDTYRTSSFKAALGISPSAFVWVMAGTPTYRKGFDLLAKLAMHFANYPCHFIWLGYGQQTGLTYLVESQIASNNLTNVTLLAPQTNDYYNYMNVADAFLLSSREEPFGNVMIDAASLGKPIVASAEGGAIEFMQPGMGELVAYSTLANFIEAMERMMQSPNAYDKRLLISRSIEYSADTQVNEWEKKILTLF